MAMRIRRGIEDFGLEARVLPESNRIDPAIIDEHFRSLQMSPYSRKHL
jgi:hypothetical protein